MPTGDDKRDLLEQANVALEGDSHYALACAAIDIATTLRAIKDMIPMVSLASTAGGFLSRFSNKALASLLEKIVEGPEDKCKRCGYERKRHGDGTSTACCYEFKS